MYPDNKPSQNETTFCHPLIPIELHKWMRCKAGMGLHIWRQIKNVIPYITTKTNWS